MATRNPGGWPGDLRHDEMKRISPVGLARVADLEPPVTGEIVTKSDREIMEILEAYDLTGCAYSAGKRAGCDPKTVNR